ncbi:MAG: hypothetical protein ACR2IQ_00460 [Minisyncoccia bacterium]
MQRNYKTMIRNTALCLFAFTIVSYGIYRFYPYLRGVELSVENIHTGDTITTPTLTLSGTAPRAHKLEINNSPISIDKKGNFSEPIILPDGYNIVTVSASDAFGKTSTEVYHIVVRDAVNSTVGFTEKQKTFTILD